MEKYESRQHRILRPIEEVYPMISDFTRLTPALKDRVDNWTATEDTCSFTVKGFNVSLRMEERAPLRHVKVVGGGGVPMDFAFWIQLVGAAPSDTRMRMVLHVELNLAMRMMLGSKLQDGIEKAAEMFATAMNAR